MIKLKLSICIFFLAIVGCSKTFSVDDIVLKADGKYYSNENQLFSGNIEKTSIDGSKKFTAKLKNGVFYGVPSFYIKNSDNKFEVLDLEAKYINGEFYIPMMNNDLDVNSDNIGLWLNEMALDESYVDPEENSALIMKDLFKIFNSFYKKEVAKDNKIFAYSWSEPMGYTYADASFNFNSNGYGTGRLYVCVIDCYDERATGEYYFYPLWYSDNLPKHELVVDKNGKISNDDYCSISMELNHHDGNFITSWPGSNPDRLNKKLNWFLNQWKNFSYHDNENMDKFIEAHNIIFSDDFEKNLLDIRKEKAKNRLIKQNNLMYCEIENRWRVKRIPDFNEYYWL